MKTIRELRVEQGLTQLALAIRLGVTPTTVSAWERGMYEPRASQLRKLAKELNVRMDEIDTEPKCATGKTHARD